MGTLRMAISSRGLGILGAGWLFVAAAWSSVNPAGQCVGFVTEDPSGTKVINCGTPCVAGCVNVQVETQWGSGFNCQCITGPPNQCCQATLVGNQVRPFGRCGTPTCPPSNSVCGLIVGPTGDGGLIYLPWCLPQQGV